MNTALVRGVGLLFVLGIGCAGGERPVPVSGTVTLEGKPQADVWVLFNPIAGGRLASGHTDAEGKFALTTSHEGDGAVPGSYYVTFAYAGAQRPPRPEFVGPPFERRPREGRGTGLSRPSTSPPANQVINPSYQELDKARHRIDVPPREPLHFDLRPDGT
jgi:hypothetical protein